MPTVYSDLLPASLFVDGKEYILQITKDGKRKLYYVVAYYSWQRGIFSTHDDGILNREAECKYEYLIIKTDANLQLACKKAGEALKKFHPVSKKNV